MAGPLFCRSSLPAQHLPSARQDRLAMILKVYLCGFTRLEQNSGRGAVCLPDNAACRPAFRQDKGLAGQERKAEDSFLTMRHQGVTCKPVDYQPIPKLDSM